MLTFTFCCCFLCLSEKPKAPRDWANLNYDKMRVKELREILSEWGAKCEGCNEKGDFIRLIKELLPTKVGAQKPAETKKEL